MDKMNKKPSVGGAETSTPPSVSLCPSPDFLPFLLATASFTETLTLEVRRLTSNKRMDKKLNNSPDRRSTFWRVSWYA